MELIHIQNLLSEMFWQVHNNITYPSWTSRTSQISNSEAVACDGWSALGSCTPERRTGIAVEVSHFDVLRQRR
jgi:hypothetical protein